MRAITFIVFVLFLAACESPPPQPTPTPRATAPTPTREEGLLELAKDGALPVVRGGEPIPEWKISLLGGDVTVTYPMTIGADNAQTVRQAQTQAAGVVKRLFDGDSSVESVNAIGTLPEASGELPAVSIVVERSAMSSWDGTAANLGDWNISPRLR